MNRYLSTVLAWLPVALATSACSVASAADNGSATSGAALSEKGGGEPQPHRPPQAAFDACKNSNEGAACSVSFHGRTIEGTCRKGPDGEDALACVPAHPPGPPPAAVEACKTASEGATCQVTFHGETLDGSCRKGPRGESVLACFPDHPPAPPQ